MTDKDIRILLVDDHQGVRDGLRRILEQEKDMLVVGQGANSEEAMSQVEHLLPSVVLMDIKMPGMDGIELVRLVKNRRPSCNIIMLTLYDEYLPQAMEAGAAGYLLKDIKYEDLAQAIRRVSNGEVVIGDNISERLKNEYMSTSGYARDNTNGDCEEVQLLMPLPVEANTLMRFANQLEDLLHSRVLQIVGSWREGTIMTMVLPFPMPLTDIILTLSEMPGIESVSEVTVTDDTNSSLIRRASLVPGHRNKPRKTLFVNLARE